LYTDGPYRQLEKKKTNWRRRKRKKMGVKGGRLESKNPDHHLKKREIAGEDRKKKNKPRNP